MPQQYPFFFGNGSITSGATAVSVESLITTAMGFVPKGACVSLNVTCSTNTYWGYSSSVTNTDGALVPANTPVVDNASGQPSDTIPISQQFIYNNSGGSSSVVIYARFIP